MSVVIRVNAMIPHLVLLSGYQAACLDPRCGDRLGPIPFPDGKGGVVDLEWVGEWWDNWIDARIDSIWHDHHRHQHTQVRQSFDEIVRGSPLEKKEEDQ